MEEGKTIPKRKVRVLPKKPPTTPPADSASNPVPNPLPPSNSQERLLVTDPEALFQCQICNQQLKQWLLYIDQPCSSMCQCCVKCLFDQGGCNCGRTLSQSEKEMVRIYYETFVPQDWPIERILAKE